MHTVMKNLHYHLKLIVSINTVMIPLITLVVHYFALLIFYLKLPTGVFFFFFDCMKIRVPLG